MSNIIKVLSYNIFWEALMAAKTMKHCIINNNNKCVDNIAVIIHYCIDKDFDFIGLQEITENQYNDILKFKLETNSKLKNYNIVFTSIYDNTGKSKAGIVTLYYNKYKLIYYNGGRFKNVSVKETRVYQYLIFDNNLIFINLQLPHADKYDNYDSNSIKNNITHIFNNINKYIKNKDYNNIKDYKIIIIGDFNNDESFKNFKLYKYGFIMPNTGFPITCCYNHFNKKFDNIYSTFGINNIFNLKLKYINKININNNWMSDHLPIISKISY